jgi:hypothetical protein
MTGQDHDLGFRHLIRALTVMEFECHKSELECVPQCAVRAGLGTIAEGVQTPLPFMLGLVQGSMGGVGCPLGHGFIIGFILFVRTLWGGRW